MLKPSVDCEIDDAAGQKGESVTEQRLFDHRTKAANRRENGQNHKRRRNRNAEAGNYKKNKGRQRVVPLHLNCRVFRLIGKATIGRVAPIDDPAIGEGCDQNEGRESEKNRPVKTFV